nr:MinD/ParA family protein [Mycobacterium sp. D16Q16]
MSNFDGSRRPPSGHSAQPDEADTAPLRIPRFSSSTVPTQRQPPLPPLTAPPQAPPTFEPVATPFTTADRGNPSGSPDSRQPRLPTPGELGLIRRVQAAPERGWRRAIHRMTGINPGESDKANSFKRLTARVNQPVRGDYSIAVLSLKGGVGKTTTTVGLGSTFAAVRGDRVIAIDANPDFGTLAQRAPKQSNSTVRDLLLDERLSRYSDIRRHTSQNSSRLEILASERDPATSESFSEADYRSVMQMLKRFYNIILTDCGTGLVHSAMAGVLAEADSLVLVVSPAIDAARSGLATLDWLSKNGYAHLVPGSVVAVSAARPGAVSVDIDLLARQFLTRARAVHVIPYDDHLAQGSEVTLDLVGWKGRQAFLELAASVADGFTHPHTRDGWNTSGWSTERRRR